MGRGRAKGVPCGVWVAVVALGVVAGHAVPAHSLNDPSFLDRLDKLARAPQHANDNHHNDDASAFPTRPRTARAPSLGVGDAGAAACLGWVSTDGCSPHGARNPRNDLPCNAVVPSSLAGYCACTNASVTHAKHCGHLPFTCAHACAMLAPPATNATSVQDPDSEHHPIPRVLHQFGDSWNVFHGYSTGIQSWLKLHPGWQYRFWTRDDVAEVVTSEYPDVAPLYESLSGSDKSSVGQLCVLHAHGGLVADLDTVALRPMDSLLEHQSFAIAEAPRAFSVLVQGKERVLSTAIVASSRAHRVLSDVLHDLRAMGPALTLQWPLAELIEAAINKHTDLAVLAANRVATGKNGGNARGDHGVRVLPWQLLLPSLPPTFDISHLCHEIGCEDAQSIQCGRAQREICSSIHHYTTVSPEAFAQRSFVDVPEPPSPLLAITRITHTLPGGWRKRVRDVHGDIHAQGRTFGPLPLPSTAIPRHIHHVWCSKDRIPPLLEPMVKSWLLLHPDWEYSMWEWDDVSELLQTHPIASQWKLGDDLSHHTKHLVSCAAILWAKGGVCVRLDVEALRPLPDLLGSSQLLLGQELPIKGFSSSTRDHEPDVGDTVLGSVPKHRFWDGVLKHLRVLHEGRHDDVGAAEARNMNRAALGTALSKDIMRLPGVAFVRPWVLHPQRECEDDDQECPASSDQDGEESFVRDHWLLGHPMAPCDGSLADMTALGLLDVVGSLPDGWREVLANEATI